MGARTTGSWAGRGCPLNIVRLSTLLLTCWPGLVRITDRRTYPALESGRETAIELEVHAEVG